MSLVFLAGDVMTGRGIDQVFRYCSEPGLAEEFAKDARDYVMLAEMKNGSINRPVEPAYIWGDALEVLDHLAPDARIINLETSITKSEERWEGKRIHYRMHPGNVECLTAARIDVCALSNNHILDYGYRGLADTLETLERAHIQTAGAGRSLDEAMRPAQVDRNQCRFVVFGLGAPNSGIPSLWAAAHDRGGVAFLRDLSEETASEIAERMATVKEVQGATIVSIHWGSNWGYGVPAHHVEFAHRLVDAGADIVHGHSSHHPRPIEIYRGRLILYGCGDLINDYEGIERHEAFRGDLVLMYFAALEPSSGELIELTMKPMHIEKLSLRRASSPDVQWLAARLNEFNADFGTRISLQRDGMLRLDWRAQR